jgi:NADPH-dependent 7-cyano-7-deazaguanine reductase QueF
LDSLEQKLIRMQQKKKRNYTTEDERILKLERQVKRKYPDIEIDTELLKSVGKLSNIPSSKDKEILRQVIAERYD